MKLCSDIHGFVILWLFLLHHQQVKVFSDIHSFQKMNPNMFDEPLNFQNLNLYKYFGFKLQLYFSLVLIHKC